MGFPFHLLCRCACLFFAACELAAPSMVLGQATPPAVSSAGLWLQYTGDHPMTRNTQIHFDAIVARGGDSYRPDFILIRPGVRRTIHGPMSAMLAYAYFEAYETRTGIKADLHEHRISQDLQWLHSLPGGSPEHAEVVLRFRYEERFRSFEGSSSTDWSLAQRTRYLISGKASTPWRLGNGRPDYLNLYDEVFVGVAASRGGFSFDQNQSGISAGWHLRDGVDLEFGYLHVYAADANPQIGAHQHILRLNLVSHSKLRRR